MTRLLVGRVKDAPNAIALTALTTRDCLKPFHEVCAINATLTKATTTTPDKVAGMSAVMWLFTAQTPMFGCASHEGLRGDAKLVQYGGQVTVNKLAQQSGLRSETIITSAAAKDIQPIVKCPNLWEQETDITTALSMALAVHSTPSQRCLKSVNNSIKSNRHCPIGIRCERSVETLQERQVVLRLRQMNAFRRHFSSPAEQEVSLRQNKFVQRLALTENHIGYERQFAQLVNHFAFRFCDGIHNRKVRFRDDDSHLQTFITPSQQNGFNLWKLRDSLNEALDCFFDTFLTQNCRRSHSSHLGGHFDTCGGEKQ